MNNKIFILVINLILFCNLSCDKSKKLKTLESTDKPQDQTSYQEKEKTNELNIDSFDEINSSFIEREQKGELTYNKVNEIVTDLDNDGNLDKLYMYNYNGWEETEPGDFRKIEINTKKKYVLKNVNSWIRLSNMNIETPLIDYKEKDNDYYVSLDFGFNNPVIVVFGYWFADTPGYISIFTFEHDKPELIFNKPFHVTKIEEGIDSKIKKLVGTYKNQNYELVIEGMNLKFRKI